MVQSGTGNELILIQANWKLIMKVDRDDRTAASLTPMAIFNLESNPGEKEEENLVKVEENQELIREMSEKYGAVRNEGMK